MFQVQLQSLIAQAGAAKEAVGRSEAGRDWAVACTDLEKVAAWVEAKGLDIKPAIVDTGVDSSSGGEEG